MCPWSNPLNPAGETCHSQTITVNMHTVVNPADSIQIVTLRHCCETLSITNHHYLFTKYTFSYFGNEMLQNKIIQFL